MSTLPVHSRVGPGASTSVIVARGGTGSALPARRDFTAAKGPERPFFVIERPHALSDPRAAVVVISVGVARSPAEKPALPVDAREARPSRSPGLPILADPYLRFDGPDRGELVDQYA